MIGDDPAILSVVYCADAHIKLGENMPTKSGNPRIAKKQGETKTWGFWRQLLGLLFAPVKSGADDDPKGKTRLRWAKCAGLLIPLAICIAGFGFHNKLLVDVLTFVALLLVAYSALAVGLITDESKRLYPKALPPLVLFAQMNTVFVGAALLYMKIWPPFPSDGVRSAIQAAVGAA